MPQNFRLSDNSEGIATGHDTSQIPSDVRKWRSASAATQIHKVYDLPVNAYINSKSSPDGTQLIGLVSNKPRLLLAGSTDYVPGANWNGLDAIQTLLANQ